MFASLPFPELHPALITIPSFSFGDTTLGPFPIRWYALAYIAGLMLAWRYAIELVRRPRLFGGKSPFTIEHIDDLLFWATLGVILGGRMGYVLFYILPYQPQTVFSDPLTIFRVWDGGMSFHGGFVGVCVAMIWVAKSRGLSLLKIADIGAVTAPIGIFLGRIANFIGAELFGRPTDGPMGMIFPQGRGSGGTPEAFNWNTGEWVYSGREVARHPSQLYEAALEGLLLFIVLAIAVWSFKILRRPGFAAGIFMIGYGLGRSIAEQFRMPDSFVQGLPEGVTMGALLSIPMWLLGAYLIWNALRSEPITDIPESSKT